MRSGFLISAPQMSDPFFERSVVLLCEFNEDGAIGIVVNRPAPMSVGEIMDEVKLDRPMHAREPAWWGGPVGRGTCFVVWQGRTTGDEGWTVGDQIAVSQSRARLADLVERNKHFHVSVGYSGWGRDQLTAEIERGSWLYTEADPALLFETPMAQRYDFALALLGLTASMVVMTPGDA